MESTDEPPTGEELDVEVELSGADGRRSHSVGSKEVKTSVNPKSIQTWAWRVKPRRLLSVALWTVSGRVFALWLVASAGASGTERTSQFGWWRGDLVTVIAVGTALDSTPTSALATSALRLNELEAHRRRRAIPLASGLNAHHHRARHRPILPLPLPLHLLLELAAARGPPAGVKRDLHDQRGSMPAHEVLLSPRVEGMHVHLERRVDAEVREHVRVLPRLADAAFGGFVGRLARLGLGGEVGDVLAAQEAVD